MNEDLRPCYDIESDWVITFANSDAQVFTHKDDPNLCRVIDFRSKTIFFTDTKRITPSCIIDIYRDIGMENKLMLVPFITKVMNAEKPVALPYVHEEIHVYIEFHKDTLGILYYKDTDEDKNIVAVKRFFKFKRDPVLSFTEITREEFVRESSDE